MGVLLSLMASGMLASTVPQMVPSTPPPAPPQNSPGGRWPPRQAPSFYRFELGDFEVVALLDGTHPFQAEQLAVGAKPGEVANLLGRQFQTSPTEGGFSAFLIRMPGRTVLIDTGAGDLYGRDGGLLVSNMMAAGIDPSGVDDIYLTHLHRDHVGGLLKAGRMVFPNAIVRASATDAAFWLDDANRAKVPAFLGTMFDGAQASLRPYIAAGRFMPFADGEALAPGITAIVAPGHTPGHRQYLVRSRGKALLVWGDTVHVAPVQFPDPEVAMRFDTDPAAAIASREAAMSRAAAEGWFVAGAHLSFPGIGRIRRGGAGGFEWVPIPYSLNRMPQ